jgi:hypothetical protein
MLLAQRPDDKNDETANHSHMLAIVVGGSLVDASVFIVR